MKIVGHASTQLSATTQNVIQNTLQHTTLTSTARRL
jgi:hypothetical protein